MITIRVLQVQPAPQQAAFHHPAQAEPHGQPHHRRGQHGRERGHELLRVCGHPLRQHRPLGQGASGEEDCRAGGRAQGVPARQGRFAHPVGDPVGQPSLQQRHHREGAAGHGRLREPRAVRQGGQEAQPVEDRRGNEW